MDSINRGRLRPWLGALLVISGLTCTDGTGPRKGRVAIAIAPVFSPQAAAIYSNAVAAGLKINNVRLTLNHADGTPAKDTTVSIAAGQDSVIIEMVVDIDGSQETFKAKIDLRDGSVILFSGTQDVTAIAGAAPQAPPPPIKVEFTGPGATVASIAVAPSDSTVTTTTGTVVYRPSAKDKNNAPVTDFGLLWTVKDPALGSVSTSGVFTAGGTRGQTYVVARTLNNIKDSAHVSIVPPATKVVLISGGAQTGTVGKALTQQVVVEAQAADNLAVSGAAITIGVTAGGGTVAPSGPVTVGTDGRVTLTFTLGSGAGTHTVQASGTGLTTLSVNATGVADVAAKLSVSQQPSATVAAGSALASQPKVQLQDQFGNPVAATGKLVVAALTSASGRTLGGTVSVATDAAGVATFTNLAVSGSAGSTTLTFTQEALTAATSNAIDVGAGAATKLAVAQQPSPTAASSVVLTTQPIVQLQDQFGNPVAAAGKLVVAALTAPGGRTLGGTLSVATDAAGTATFTNLSVSGPTGSTTLTFTQEALTTATSNAIVLGAGAATKLVMTTPPSPSSNSGDVLAQQPVLRISDAAENTVTTSAASVTVSASAGYTLSGPLTVSAGTGVVTFANVAVTGPPGAALLTFASSGLTSETATVNVTAAFGPPAHLFPTSLAAVAIDTIEAIIAPASVPQVVVKDAANNSIPGVVVKFTRHGSAGGLMNGLPVVDIMVTTGADGLASLTSRQVGGAISIDSVIATVAGLSDTVAFVVGVLNGKPHHMAFLSTASNALVAQLFSVVVGLQDRLNNPAAVLSGTPPNVTLSVQPGTGDPAATLGPPLALTAAATAGIATFAVQVDKEGAAYQLVASSSGLPSITDAPFDVAIGPPATIAVVRGDGQAALKNAFLTDSIVVQLKDAAGNNVPNTVVTFTLQGGGSLNAIAGAVYSDANGRIARRWQTGYSGDQLLTIQSGAASVTVQAFMAEILYVVTEPTLNPSSGVMFARQPRVILKDLQGRHVHLANVPITALAQRDPASQALSTSLTGTSIVNTDINGEAQFTNLAITGQTPVATPQTVKLRFLDNCDCSNAPNEVFSQIMTLQGGPATHLGFTPQPTTVAPNTAFSVTVAALDALNNVAPDFTGNVTLAIGTNPSSGTLSGTLTATAVAGVATFSGLSINNAGSGYTLTASASGPLAGTSTPFGIAVPVIFASLSVGDQSACALSTVGTVYCWGSGTGGGLGADDALALCNDTYQSPSRCPKPMLVSGGGLPPLASIAKGDAHTCGLTAAGVAWCWGSGTNLAGFTGTPALLPGGRTFSSISAGYYEGCGVETISAAAYCWGYNSGGALGYNPPSGYGTTASGGGAVSGGHTFASVTAGTSNTCGLTSSGAAWCWGNNFYGQLGIAFPRDTSIVTPQAVIGGIIFGSLSVGNGIVCGLGGATANEGTAYCWGHNDGGELGNASPAHATSPTAVVTALKFASISVHANNTCAVTAAGDGYCWGSNYRNALAQPGGQSGHPDSPVPTLVPGGLTFASITVGNFWACGLTTSGAVYCWGTNDYGALGYGSLTPPYGIVVPAESSVPTLITPP